MSSILNKQVIKLNRHWQAFEVMNLADACTFLCSMSNGEHPGFVMDFEVVLDENGKQILTYVNPVSIEEWMKLPIRDCDESVGIGMDRDTGAIRYMRAPTVVICAKFDRVPETSVKWSPAAVRARDGDTCQISKRKLGPGEGNVGHDVAQSINPQRRRDFTNTVWMDKRLNTIQGTKTFAEMGWKLDKKPTAPKTRVKILTADDVEDPMQLPFVLK